MVVQSKKFCSLVPPQISKCMTKTDLHAPKLELHYLTVLETLSVTFRLVPKLGTGEDESYSNFPECL